ncbi:bifunctional [glutamate--ammonia ligase]-adenylyl-L-tyrosine phosphorylase/[glutamate--ammonia-ligase] adenylyltransferase [Pararhodobacter oceanensis]|uniref:bifunctional [glutamate--ammonia ligase]-adenylyl-L-tyrosine phosphorylase/[glutamate--ammonia-ligase] adenylyltransferase n=1 Tax=Pararhodobacter oceanensis TaxID=2172121 RepID=UPI003A902D7B
MTDFASRLTRAPLAYDPDAGAEAEARFADQPPELRAVLAGAAGCSPFLKSLMGIEAEWLRDALAQSPEAALEAELAALTPAAPAETGSMLRRAKRRIALLAALADLGGVWALEEVTLALTRLADTAVQRALASHLAEEIRRGKIPDAQPGDEERGAGMVAFAMGKMGAYELNYSSDIDLICLFDDSQFDAGACHEARQAFIRATRKTAALLNDHTGEGYVFRTDLRLRPDGSVTPVCLSMEAAERYYESLGRTWERAAWIKARPCAGDLAAGARFLETLRPFVWRRHLDYAAIQDAHDMRLRIRDHKGLGGALALAGHDMKLGQGGIREIEFFTQTRQLISGGRDPELRLRGTVEGLAALAAQGWIPAPQAAELTAHYRAHREVEHRLQMINDAQTHILPGTPEGFARLACFMGQSDSATWQHDLLERLAAVQSLTEEFFAPGSPAGPDTEAPELSEHQEAIVSGWRSYPAMRSSRAQEIFKRLQPELLSRLLKAPMPDEAVIGFDRFLSGLPAGVQLFSLFEANPTLIDLLIDVLTTAPELGEYLARNSGVFDAVIGGDFFADWPQKQVLAQDLAERLAASADYEHALDALRAWHKEWHFRIGVHHLRGLIDGVEAATQYAQLADTVLTAIWPLVAAEFARKHGAAPGRGAVVLGMGSLGAGRLNAASDLDLIVIYDAAGQEGSEGKRPLAARPYYARLTQALVTALSAPMAQGRLYEVDMRLRPSGRQGPVATAIKAFEAYQRDEAWTWEHLALTRARAVAGSADLAAEVEAFRSELLAQKSKGEGVAQAVAEMRARLQSAKPARGALDAKDGAGRLQDIELMAQMLALQAAAPARKIEAQLLAGRRAGLIEKEDEQILLGAYRLLWRVQCAQRLLGDRVTDAERLGDGAQAFLLRETDAETLDALTAELAEVTAQAAQVINAALPVSSSAAGDTAG